MIEENKPQQVDTEVKKLREENQKLKELLFLTDPAVENITMNDITMRQARELMRWQEERN